MSDCIHKLCFTNICPGCNPPHPKQNLDHDVDSSSPGLLFALFPHSASAWSGSFVYRLYSSLFPSFLCCLWRFFRLQNPLNYCNRMMLRNKKPHFPPTPGKYPLSLKKITTKPIRAYLFFTFTKSCAQKHNTEFGITCCMLQIHICALSIRGQFQAPLILSELSGGISRR